MPHFYTTYYSAPKESKNIDGPISFAPLMTRPILFASPNDVSKKISPPPLTRKFKVPKTPQKHKKSAFKEGSEFMNRGPWAEVGGRENFRRVLGGGEKKSFYN